MEDVEGSGGKSRKVGAGASPSAADIFTISAAHGNHKEDSEEEDDNTVTLGGFIDKVNQERSYRTKCMKEEMIGKQ